MIRHLVMWKFRPNTEAEQAAFFSGLQGLYGVIPQLKRCEIHTNLGSGSYDAVLLSEFETPEDLRSYLDDPRHQAVSALCKRIRTDRASVDYQI